LILHKILRWQSHEVSKEQSRADPARLKDAYPPLKRKAALALVFEQTEALSAQWA